MCCAFIIKYVLFVVNTLFAIVGIAICSLGIALFFILRDLNEIVPVNIIPTVVLVVGIILFLISCLACCGAINESRCLLISYAIAVAFLLAIKIWLAIEVFSALDDIRGTVDGWVQSAFDNNNTRPAFHVLEASFQCCGTTGPEAYSSEDLPFTCCSLPEGILIPDIQELDLENLNITDINDLDSILGFNVTDIEPCTMDKAFVGCSVVVGNWFESIGGLLGALLLVVIAVEAGAIIFSLFFCSTIKSKRKSVY